jgi:hypothetical protein
MAINELALVSWDEIHDHGRANWLFRGERVAGWQLKTSLERLFERQAMEGPARMMLERELLREFRRAYHNYAVHVPQRESVLEWLSLMQHHGAPTRLLDFTYSIYVAAYFALESADDDCAVWGVNADWVAEQSVLAMLAAGKQGASKLRARTGEEHETVSFDVLFEPPFVRCAMLLSPFRLNERLRIQKGTFLVPGDVASGFMENLTSLPGHDQAANVLKIVLPAPMRAEALERLHYMNISRTSLFPGLDGYARSLGIYHPAFQRNRWREKA